jgi:hypothetical protein
MNLCAPSPPVNRSSPSPPITLGEFDLTTLGATSSIPIAAAASMQTTMRATMIFVVSFIFYEQYGAITEVIDAATIFIK